MAEQSVPSSGESREQTNHAGADESHAESLPLSLLLRQKTSSNCPRKRSRGASCAERLRMSTLCASCQSLAFRLRLALVPLAQRVSLREVTAPGCRLLRGLPPFLRTSMSFVGWMHECFSRSLGRESRIHLLHRADASSPSTPVHRCTGSTTSASESTGARTSGNTSRICLTTSRSQPPSRTRCAVRDARMQRPQICQAAPRALLLARWRGVVMPFDTRELAPSGMRVPAAIVFKRLASEFHTVSTCKFGWLLSESNLSLSPLASLLPRRFSARTEVSRHH